MSANAGFRFGLEGEYLLVDADSYRPLWHPDLDFESLHALLEEIPYQRLVQGLTLDGLELDPPHHRIMPYYVEGYGLPDATFSRWVDLLPKGIEIRTPVCPSIEVCLEVYEELYQALQAHLEPHGYRAIALAHHPTAWAFRGPQNHRRQDWWEWGMRAMTTYGPDVNMSLPESQRPAYDWEALQRRVNYYAPALMAFSVASPLGRGQLWEPNGRPGLSLRTYRRSPYAPAVAAHPKEQGRLEFKAFDMPADRSEFRLYFLLWLWLAIDDRATGSADDQDRIYDLGAVARFGWDALDIPARAEEALDRAERLLPALDVDPAPLQILRDRLGTRSTPADPLVLQLEIRPDVPDFLRFLDAIASSPQCSASAQPHLV